MKGKVLSGLSLFVLFLVPLNAAADTQSAKRMGRAFEALDAGDFTRAYRETKALNPKRVLSREYALLAKGQAAFAIKKYDEAAAQFSALSKFGNRFQTLAKWRYADALYAAGKRARAVDGYKSLLRGKSPKTVDSAVAAYRVALAESEKVRRDKLKKFLIEYPLHPLEDEVRAELSRLKVDEPLTDSDKLKRAAAMRDDHSWHEAIAEIGTVDVSVNPSLKVQRDYQRGITLFKMRRRYEDAGRILLSIYEKMGSDAPYTMFHGARALSRADKDKEAISWYQKMVKKYPWSKWSQEAQYLSGWLEFNLGNYKLAIPHLEEMMRKYPRSKWIKQTRWFLAMSHYFAGNYEKALPGFTRIKRGSGKWNAGKGHYWEARTLHKLKRIDEAKKSYRALVGRYPFSWYALLARSRAKELGETVPIFGDSPASYDVTKINGKVDSRLAEDTSVRKADELAQAGMKLAASREMENAERRLIRKHGKAKALSYLMDRYRKANNFNRPWYMAIVYGGSRALNAPPKGNNRAWWEHAYPLAYNKLVTKHQKLGGSPDYFLQSIMRKESGFNPNTRSYAEALGLLQMIPPTTRRVVKKMGLEYSDDFLYDPELNIQTGSWYIGRLLAKFRGQIPVGAGSFNSGPKAVMKWCKRNPNKPMDEWVELVSYRQTRLYMKKVTETYARYLYLYGNKEYWQPLTVRTDYIDNEINY